MKTFLYGTLVALTIFGAIVHLLYFPHLPDRVASHFNAAGKADGFLSKGSYMAMMLGLNFGVSIFMGGLAWAIKFMPASMINVPHKEYWLSPSRRPYTDKLNETILLVVGIATSIFLTVLGHLTHRANCRNEDLSNGIFIVSLVIYLVVVLSVAFGSYARLLRIPAAESDS